MVPCRPRRGVGPRLAARRRGPRRGARDLEGEPLVRGLCGENNINSSRYSSTSSISTILVVVVVVLVVVFVVVVEVVGDRR